jgi:hypothetical protein|tara:strand:+ start:411 stop:743 length:333 start_codon:yes stop_codon:yes gene_type:complete
LPLINNIGSVPPTVAVNVPEIANAGLTVTVIDPVQFEVEVNVITAVDCVVTDFAVTIPVVLTVATLLSSLLHVPPVTVEDNVTVSASHNTEDPEATETEGRSSTVTVTSS